MPAFFGLDIGATGIKAVQSSLRGSKSFFVENLGLVNNPAGSIDFTDASVREKIKPALKQLLTETKMRERRAVVAVSEGKVFSRVLSLPLMSEAELSTAIKWEAEQFVPIPVDEVELDYSVINKSASGSEKKMLVYLVAAPKKYLEGMVTLLTDAGIEPIAVESEMVAVSRALTYGDHTGVSLIVSLGAMQTVIAVIDGADLTFSYVIPTGGVAMTRALSQSLGLPLPQAEEYKRTYGLQDNQLEGKVKTGLMIVMDTLVKEIRKAMEYQVAEKKRVVNRIILSGGGAYLPELSGYLTSLYGSVEVVLGDPFAMATFTKGLTLPVTKAVYTVAVGCSLRIN